MHGSIAFLVYRCNLICIQFMYASYHYNMYFMYNGIHIAGKMIFILKQHPASIRFSYSCIACPKNYAYGLHFLLFYRHLLLINFTHFHEVYFTVTRESCDCPINQCAHVCSKVVHEPLARYAKLRVAHAPGIRGTFSSPLRVSDPDMHHSTCVKHVPWCMPGSLTSGFRWSRWQVRFPAFPAHAQPAILRIWQEAIAGYATVRSWDFRDWSIASEATFKNISNAVPLLCVPLKLISVK